MTIPQASTAQDQLEYAGKDRAMLPTEHMGSESEW